VTGVKGIDDGGIDYDDLAPSWSQDGGLLAFYSKRDSNAEIYVVRPDGSGLRRVTTTVDIDERMPRWLDAGTIVSAITRSNAKGVALIDVNTGGYYESGADAARRVDTVDGYK
jgi:Tol biopolymer transport system component